MNSACPTGNPLTRVARFCFQQKWLVLATQGVLAAGLFWLLYRQLSTHPDLTQSLAALRQRLHQAHGLSAALPILLTGPNWLLEAAKWHLLLNRSHRISFAKTFSAVLAGISLALITPQRIGEYAGRLMLLPPGARWAGLCAKITGNAAQWLITLSVGGLAAMVLARQMDTITPNTAGWCAGIHVLLMLTAGFFYLNPQSLKRVIPRSLPAAGILRHARPLSALLEWQKPDLMKVLFMAALRYGVYGLQYFLLLGLFGVPVALPDAATGIGAFFFWQSVFPLTNLAGLAVRSNLAVWIWGHFGADPVAGLGAALFLWIINLVLPALFGTFCLMRVRISK